MSDEVWRRDDGREPLRQGSASSHPATGLCLGCYRTIEEIAGWSAMTPGGAARGDGRAAGPRGTRQAGPPRRPRRPRQARVGYTFLG